MLLSTVLGTLLAFAVVRGRYPGKSLLNQFALLPLIVPVIVYSIAVYGLFAQLRLIGDWQAIVLGHTVHAIPFVVIIVAAALRTFDENYELAAMSLGASRLRAVWRITLPQIRPALISAMFLAFITSFDELVVAMFLGGSNMTLPKKMFDNIVNAIDPTIAAVSVLQIVLVTAVLALFPKLAPGPLHPGRVTDEPQRRDPRARSRCRSPRSGGGSRRKRCPAMSVRCSTTHPRPFRTGRPSTSSTRARSSPIASCGLP